MTTVYLIRHGEVAGNSGAHRTFAGARDLPLTSRGELQMQAVANRMKSEKLDAIYSSTLQRAWRTAEAVAAQHELQNTRLDAWREVDYGAWEGLSEAEIARDWGELWRERVADPWNIAPPEGESYQVLWARLEPAWNELIEQHRGQSVAVVGHNGSLRVLLCQLLEAPPTNARRLQIGNCALTKVVVDEASNGAPTLPSGKLLGPPVVISYINNTSHLENL